MDLDLDVVAHDGFVVLALRGKVDISTAPQLRERLVELVAEASARSSSISTVSSFLDSAGRGVLVGGLKRLRSHDGNLTLVCTHRRLLKAFAVTGPRPGVQHRGHARRGRPWLAPPRR